MNGGTQDNYKLGGGLENWPTKSPAGTVRDRLTDGYTIAKDDHEKFKA